MIVALDTLVSELRLIVDEGAPIYFDANAEELQQDSAEVWIGSEVLRLHLAGICGQRHVWMCSKSPVVYLVSVGTPSQGAADTLYVSGGWIRNVFTEGSRSFILNAYDIRLAICSEPDRMFVCARSQGSYSLGVGSIEPK